MKQWSSWKCTFYYSKRRLMSDKENTAILCESNDVQHELKQLQSISVVTIALCSVHLFTSRFIWNFLSFKKLQWMIGNSPKSIAIKLRLFRFATFFSKMIFSKMDTYWVFGTFNPALLPDFLMTRLIIKTVLFLQRKSINFEEAKKIRSTRRTRKQNKCSYNYEGLFRAYVFVYASC